MHEALLPPEPVVLTAPQRGVKALLALLLGASALIALEPRALHWPALRGSAEDVVAELRPEKVGHETEGGDRPYLGQGDKLWWVPFYAMIGAAACVAAIGYLTAPDMEEQWKPGPRGCQEGEKFFLYKKHCDKERFLCEYCGQTLCKYHLPINTKGVKGGHSDCPGCECQIEPWLKKDCSTGDLFPCDGCKKEFCSVHANLPDRPPDQRPGIVYGHRCTHRNSGHRRVRRGSSFRRLGTDQDVDDGVGKAYTTTQFDKFWLAYCAPILAFALLNLAVSFLSPVYRIWREKESKVFDARAFPIPAASVSSMPAAPRDCGCVVIIGRLVLAPVLMSIATVLVVFSVNFTSTVVKIKLGWTKREHDQTLGDLVWQSVRVPSMWTQVPFLAVHVLHLVRLAYVHGTFEGIYANWVNSGMVAFVITGLYGSGLSCTMFDRELAGIGTSWLMADITKPVTFRMLASFILLVLQLPAFVWYTWFAMLKWCGHGLAAEVLSALMVQVFFPDAASNVSLFQKGCRDGATGKLTTPHIITRIAFGVFYFVVFMLFPLQEPMNFLAPYIRIKQAKSPVGPMLQTLLLSLFCLLKTWETQFLFTFELFAVNGVGYWDAVALAYTSRHVKCNLCLLLTHANRMANETATIAQHDVSEIVMESLYQLASYVA